MNTLETCGTGLAKAALFETLYSDVQDRSFMECTREAYLSNKNIQDLKRRNIPSMSMEAAIRHARLFGHTVTITVDGLVLPIGD